MLFYRLLELAVVAEPITYHSLIVRPKPAGRRPSIAPVPAVSPPTKLLSARGAKTTMNTGLPDRNR